MTKKNNMHGNGSAGNSEHGSIPEGAFTCNFCVLGDKLTHEEKAAMRHLHEMGVDFNPTVCEACIDHNHGRLMSEGAEHDEHVCAMHRKHVRKLKQVRCSKGEDFDVVEHLPLPEDMDEVLSPEELSELEEHWDELMSSGRYDFAPSDPEVEGIDFEGPAYPGGKAKVNITVKVSVKVAQVMMAQRRPYIWGVPGFGQECFGF